MPIYTYNNALLVYQDRLATDPPFCCGACCIDGFCAGNLSKCDCDKAYGKWYPDKDCRDPNFYCDSSSGSACDYGACCHRTTSLTGPGPWVCDDVFDPIELGGDPEDACRSFYPDEEIKFYSCQFCKDIDCSGSSSSSDSSYSSYSSYAASCDLSYGACCSKKRDSGGGDCDPPCSLTEICRVDVETGIGRCVGYMQAAPDGSLPVEFSTEEWRCAEVVAEPGKTAEEVCSYIYDEDEYITEFHACKSCAEITCGSKSSTNSNFSDSSYNSSGSRSSRPPRRPGWVCTPVWVCERPCQTSLDCPEICEKVAPGIFPKPVNVPDGYKITPSPFDPNLWDVQKNEFKDDDNPCEDETIEISLDDGTIKEITLIATIRRAPCCGGQCCTDPEARVCCGNQCLTGENAICCDDSDPDNPIIKDTEKDTGCCQYVDEELLPDVDMLTAQECAEKNGFFQGVCWKACPPGGGEGPDGDPDDDPDDDLLPVVGYCMPINQECFTWICREIEINKWGCVKDRVPGGTKEKDECAETCDELNGPGPASFKIAPNKLPYIAPTNAAYICDD